METRQNLMIVVGIIGLFTGVGLVEDAFAENESSLWKWKESGPAKLKLYFSSPVDLTNGNHGFEVLKNNKPVEITLKEVNPTIIRIYLKDGTFNTDNHSYTINYNGTSNNLQHDGKSTLSFSLLKAKSSDNWVVNSPNSKAFFTENNSKIINITMNLEEKFQTPSWYIQDKNAFHYYTEKNLIQHDGKSVRYENGPTFHHVGDYVVQLKINSNYFSYGSLVTNIKVIDPLAESNAPTFDVLKNGKIYSEPIFYTFQESNEIQKGQIINVEDESSYKQSIVMTQMQGDDEVFYIIYKVTDAHGNTSQISEMIISHNDYDDGLYSFGVYPDKGHRNQHIYTEWSDFDLPSIEPVELIWEIVEIWNDDQKTHQIIYTYEHALKDNVYFVDYVVYWEADSRFYSITEKIISDSDDIDNDGVLNIDDRCKLREGPIENFGCPTSFIDYGAN